MDLLSYDDDSYSIPRIIFKEPHNQKNGKKDLK